MKSKQQKFITIKLPIDIATNVQSVLGALFGKSTIVITEDTTDSFDELQFIIYNELYSKKSKLNLKK